MPLSDIFHFTVPPLYLMDASAFIYKGYYGNMKMTRSDGFPTGALYAVGRVLLRLIKEEEPQYFSFLKDGRGKNFRHEIFPLYKANRSSTPEELIMQLEPIERLVQALGLHLEISDNCEADDCIASLAMQNRDKRHVVIVGVDKDLKQCLHENVSLWDPSIKNGKEQKIITPQSFFEETGLTPSQWPDIQAIIGDTTDNIPGIRGIGEKTAEKIFADYPSLEAIRDNVENLPKTIKAKFEGNLDAMFLYRQLTLLHTDCCQHIDAEHLAVKPLPQDEDGRFVAQNIFHEFEMPSLGRELDDMIKKNKISLPQSYSSNTRSSLALSMKSSPTVKTMQKSLFDMDEEEVFEEPAHSSIKLIGHIEELPLPLDNIHIGIIQSYFIVRHSEGFYISYDNQEYLYNGNMTELRNFISPFKHIVCVDSKSILKAYPNWEFLFTQDKIIDLSLIAYLLDPEVRDYSWAKISNQYRSLLNISQSTPATLALALAEKYKVNLEKAQLNHLYQKLELPLICVLAFMESKGILLDITAIDSFLNEVQSSLNALTDKIYELAGMEFNIRSAQQIGSVLFQKLALPTMGKTKGGQSSTSQDALERLSGEHEVVDALLEFRKLEKLRSTYLEPLPKLIHEDSRLHTTFNQMATATGRLSSSNPNLQNIPIRGDMGLRMRACFVAEEGNLLISADYSQIELRVLAHYSQEPSLIESFQQNEDIHKRTAALLNNIEPEAVTSQQRRDAKTINFGLLYGMGARKLAQDMSISMKDAQAFINTYFKRFSSIKTFYETIKDDAREKGYVTTITGRRRLLPDLQSPSPQAKALAERQAVNTLIQGSAADIIKLAMLAVYNDAELKSYQTNLLLQVHDELIVSVPAEYAEKAGTRLAYLMSHVKADENNDFTIPLMVEWAAGKNWQQAH